MVDLSTTYGGVKLKNPLVLASGPPTATPEACNRAALAGFAAVVLKTHGSDEVPKALRTTVGWPAFMMADLRGMNPWKSKPPKKDSPKLSGKKGQKSKDFSLILNSPAQILTYFYKSEDYKAYVNETKKLLDKEAFVIASIVAFSEKGWADECELIRNTRADMVELNLSCPYATAEEEIYPGLPRGVPPGAVPEVIKSYTEFCVKNLDIPVIVKLPPKSSDPLSCARACVEGGASGITWSDSGFYPSLRIDIENLSVGWTPDFPTWNSSWGPWALPFTCGNIASFRISGIPVDLSASGGVYDAEDVIRCIMAGAGTVQPCRIVMVEGWDIARNWLSCIKGWMERKGYSSIGGFKGLAADKVVVNPDQLPLEVPQLAGGPMPTKQMTVILEKCIDCGWCEVCCSDLAITMSRGHPIFDRAKCVLCGLCRDICPVDAISMQDLNPT